MFIYDVLLAHCPRLKAEDKLIINKIREAELISKRGMTVFFQSPVVCRTKVSPSCLSKTWRPWPAFVRSLVRLVVLGCRGLWSGGALSNLRRAWPSAEPVRGLPIFTPMRAPALGGAWRGTLAAEQWRALSRCHALSALASTCHSKPVTGHLGRGCGLALASHSHRQLFLVCLVDSPLCVRHSTEIAISRWTGLYRFYFICCCFLSLFTFCILVNTSIKLPPREKKV